jgi:enterochelin esterase family protein
MRNLPVAVLSFLSLLPLLSAQRPEGGRQRGGPAEPPKLENFTYEQGTLKSDKVRQGEAGYGIYLPKGYADDANKDTKYPLVVWLHGFGGPGEWQNGGGAEVLDQLAGQGKLPPFAFVVFRSPGRRTTYMNGEGGGDVEDLIAQDLVTQLEGKYRLKADRGQRALMGVSMGGMGALKIALRHPQVFGTVAVHSAAILPADPAELPEQYRGMVQRSIERGGLDKVLGNPIDKAKWQEHMPLGIVSTKKKDDLQGLHVYFDAGTDDRYGFCPPNEMLDKAMTDRGLPHLFRKIEGGGHAWSSPSMKESLAVSLQFVGAAFAGKDPIAVVRELDGKPKPTDKPADKPADAGK